MGSTFALLSAFAFALGLAAALLLAGAGAFFCAVMVRSSFSLVKVVAALLVLLLHTASVDAINNLVYVAVWMSPQRALRSI